MTAILPPGGASFLTLQPHDETSDGMNDVWRRQHYHQMSLPAINHHYWPDGHGSNLGSVHEMDMRFSGEYEPSFNGGLISPPMDGYVPDSNWGSDMEIGTPSTTAGGFPSDTIDGYHNMRHTSNPSHHLPLPPRATHDHLPSSAQSPQSSHDGISPHLSYAKAPEPIEIKREERPSLIRSVTAPEPRPRRSTIVGSSGTPSVKRCGSEDEDDEYIPGQTEHLHETTKPRGRKRQRIPHTAVERRYRENLNAHLDKLRQNVPSLASKRPAGASKPGDGMGEGVKPSKCEILNGAIEHIGALGKENAALKTEVNALRSRLEDLERWCGAYAK
ncbi:uncharacterized protein CLAFUR5_03328 [Fulvia fulva]|uniref:BHLH domain-containing protein n=1 Tax=Passalora fulva TaxID=5499 RepID=A0A9Q8LA55_PASFU|nr:uncharacterized protein CLAFUR5_03328 [Fulvia fulva]KAK4633875.1 hypothetical protein CLAFUR0_03342 [Fulvia fulva]UJO13730.1 hypothetical protein CLAFUR5_03328 [Fulvia fulva]